MTEEEAALRALGGMPLRWVPGVPWERLVAGPRAIQKRDGRTPSPEAREFETRLNASRSVGYAMTDNALYEIRVRLRFYLFPRYTAFFIVDSPLSFGVYPDEFKTRAAAKAACERHFATGKWEI